MINRRKILSAIGTACFISKIFLSKPNNTFNIVNTYMPPSKLTDVYLSPEAIEDIRNWNIVHHFDANRCTYYKKIIIKDNN